MKKRITSLHSRPKPSPPPVGAHQYLVVYTKQDQTCYTQGNYLSDVLEYCTELFAYLFVRGPNGWYYGSSVSSDIYAAIVIHGGSAYHFRDERVAAKFAETYGR